MRGPRCAGQKRGGLNFFDGDFGLFHRQFTKGCLAFGDRAGVGQFAGGDKIRAPLIEHKAGWPQIGTDIKQTTGYIRYQTDTISAGNGDARVGIHAWGSLRRS